MAGPVGSAQWQGNLLHIYIGLIGPGIHGRRLGKKHDVDPGSRGYFRVTVQVTGVCLEVLAGAELGGIHENAGNEQVAPLPPFPHQRSVPLMEEPHRRHKPDLLSGASGIGRQRLHILYRFDNFHVN